MSTCYIVTGVTWPHGPTIWTSKRKAMAAAAKLRRTIRAEFPHLCGDPRGKCGIVIEPRETGDMIGRMHWVKLEEVYNQ
jgi:hypothetical protein